MVISVIGMTETAPIRRGSSVSWAASRGAAAIVTPSPIEEMAAAAEQLYRLGMAADLAAEDDSVVATLLEDR